MSVKVAVIGSGPSGFYAAEALFRSDVDVQVDVFDSLPTPYGLLRGGVAPDHQRMKSVATAYARIAANEGFRFFGNVCIGRDLSVSDLQDRYHAIIVASGAQTDRRLGIEGEELKGSHTATAFVGWYNGHPDFQDCDFDLSQHSVAIIGQGNVAVDVCRILAKTDAELASSDITKTALDALKASQVKDIYLIGRRGPVQAAFTELEIKELGQLEDAELIIGEDDLDLSPACSEELEMEGANKARKNIAVMRDVLSRPPQSKSKRIHLRFYRSPERLEGDESVSTLVLRETRLEGPAGKQKAVSGNETEDLGVGLVFRSIGYKGVPIEGLPFREDWGIIPNTEGRVETESGEPVSGVYVTGWIKRGPSGVIGTNRPDSKETVAHFLADLDRLEGPSIEGDIQDLLDEKRIRYVSFSEWERINAEEVARGEKVGKPREKFTSVSEILDFLDQ